MSKTVFEMLKETHASSTRATLIAISSFIIATLAFIASGISVYFSYLDSKTDELWQQEQISTLNRVVSAIEKQNREQSNLVDTSKKQLKASQETLSLIQEQLRELKNISKNKARKSILPIDD